MEWVTGTHYGQMASYAYKRTIDSVIQKGWYQIPLDERILSVAELDFRDIRLYAQTNSDTVEIPYIIETYGRNVTIAELPFTVINQSYDARAFYVTLKPISRQRVNQIHIHLDNPEFDWPVTIEGSDDGKEWLKIVENQRIVRIRSAHLNYEYTIVHFPLSDYAYFRLSVMAGPASPRVRFLSASVYEAQNQPGEYALIKGMQWNNVSRREQNTTLIHILMPDHYRISRVVPVIRSERNYYRSFRLLYLQGVFSTPKGEQEKWELLTSGVLSSIEKTDMVFLPVKTQKLRLEIQNYNDRPLDVENISVYGEKIVLTAELEPAQDYYLVYGKPNDSAPIYDLVHFKNKIPAFKLSAKLGMEYAMDHRLERRTVPWFLSPMWLWSAMALVMLSLGYFAWILLRDTRRSDAEKK